MNGRNKPLKIGVVCSLLLLVFLVSAPTNLFAQQTETVPEEFDIFLDSTESVLEQAPTGTELNRNVASRKGRGNQGGGGGNTSIGGIFGWVGNQILGVSSTVLGSIALFGLSIVATILS